MRAASGSELEQELRGASIWAVHLLREAMGRRVTCIQLDFYLWTEAKRAAADMVHVPIHKTRSVFY